MTADTSHSERFERLPGLRAALHDASDPAELFARSAEVLRQSFEFDRAVVLDVTGASLTAGTTAALKHAGSDVLRRTVLDRPVPLMDRTYEGCLISRLGEPADLTSPSRLADALGLRGMVLAPIAPGAEALAVLVGDRADGPRGPQTQHLVVAVAAVVAAALESLIHRMRLAELDQEIRHLATSAQALVREARYAPLALPIRVAGRPAFAAFRATPVAAPGEGLADLLTVREADVAELLTMGLTNQQIATRLVLSPATVKGYVAKVLRKLGASNRAEAVGRYLQLDRASRGEHAPQTARSSPATRPVGPTAQHTALGR